MPKHSTSIGLIAFAGTLVVGAAGFAFAQGAQAPTGKRAVAQAAPAQPPVAATAPAPSPPREWTGESGSSGHPLMQATAIRQAAANFEQCLEGLWPLAQKRGVARATYDKHVGGLTPDLRIMDLMDAQPEFTKAFWDYLDILVHDQRIAGGRELLAKYKPVFDQVEKAYGVDRHIVTSIWGVELNYGTMGGERPVIRSTATLACVGRRQAYFRDEFLATLEILHRNDVRPEQLKGSWAGAFGPTQFMPTSFKRYAVDFDGDGRRDVVELDSRSDRIDREQPEEGRLGHRCVLGLRGDRAQGLQLPAGRPRQAAHACGVGGEGIAPSRQQAVRHPAGEGLSAGARGP